MWRLCTVILLMSLLSRPARAESYYLETAPNAERTVVARMLETAKAAGFSGRIVRRFQLGSGWGYVLLVEGFDSAEKANDAATRLTTSVGGGITVFKVGGTPVAPPPSPAATLTAADWLARAREAHGGASGGSAALARAPVVHFVYERSFDMNGSRVRARHEYWRDGANRRLEVRGVGSTKVQDSVAVASASGAWMLLDSQVQTRDQGVLIGVVDGFSPESILTVAMGAWDLLNSPETADFRILEGAESGVRVGSGKDEGRMALSFVDLDPQTARVVGVRYITEAGPISCALSDYRDAAPGLVVPSRMKIQRADGRSEEVVVERLELLTASPAGNYAQPGGA